MAVASSRIIISLVDQLLDRLFAITDDVRRNPLSDSDKSIIDDQSSKIRTLKLLLDDDPSRIFLCLFERNFGVVEIDLIPTVAPFP